MPKRKRPNRQDPQPRVDVVDLGGTHDVLARLSLVGGPAAPFIPVDTWTCPAVDVQGHEGCITVTFHEPAPPPPDIAARLPPGVPTIRVFEDYSAWPPYQAIRVTIHGVELQGELPRDGSLGARVRTYRDGPDGTAYRHILVLRESIRTDPQTEAVQGHIDWHPGSDGIFHGLRSVHGVPGDWDPPLQLKKALLAFEGIHGGGGQPAYYDDANEPQFFTALIDTVHRVVRDGDRVNLSTLAERGLANWRTVKKYVKSFEYDLDALEAEANRCNRGRGQGICRVRADRPTEFKKNRP
jgi:hypothetical protein